MTEEVARIRGNGIGNTKPGLFGKALEPVIPSGDDLPTWDFPQVEVAHLLLCHLSHSCPSKPRCARFVLNGTIFIDDRPIDE